MEKTSENHEEPEPGPQSEQEQIERDSGDDSGQEHTSFIQGAGTG